MRKYTAKNKNDLVKQIKNDPKIDIKWGRDHIFFT